MKTKKEKNNMAAPKGNKFYMNRERNGRELKYKTSLELLSKAYEYFKWCDKNPWIKKEAIKSGDHAGKLIDVPTQRPYTLEGLCLYLGVSISTFKNYQDRKGFLAVTTHVREIIDTNQLEGAAVGAYNANIIARKLGLAEKAETNVKLHGEYADLSDEELTKKLKDLTRKMNDAQGEDTAN